MKKYLISLSFFVGLACMTDFASIRAAGETPPAAEKTENSSSEKSNADPREWSEPLNGISMTIWTEKSEYALGEPIIVYAQEKNERKEEYYYGDLPRDKQDHTTLFAKYRLDVFNTKLDGITLAAARAKTPQEVPLTRRGKLGFSSIINANQSYTCGPGEKTHVFHGWLNMWYDMTAPGEYEIVAELPLGENDGEPVVLKSNRLHITIKRKPTFENDIQNAHKAQRAKYESQSR